MINDEYPECWAVQYCFANDSYYLSSYTTVTDLDLWWIYYALLSLISSESRFTILSHPKVYPPKPTQPPYSYRTPHCGSRYLIGHPQLGTSRLWIDSPIPSRTLIITRYSSSLTPTADLSTHTSMIVPDCWCLRSLLWYYPHLFGSNSPNRVRFTTNHTFCPFSTSEKRSYYLWADTLFTYLNQGRRLETF